MIIHRRLPSVTKVSHASNRQLIDHRHFPFCVETLGDPKKFSHRATDGRIVVGRVTRAGQKVLSSLSVVDFEPGTDAKKGSRFTGD
jgi:hypothetical protein